MYKKENVCKHLFTNPLYFVQNISLLNNFVAGIVVFLIYIALFTIYVYLQIRKGYEIMPGEAGLVFFTDRIKSDLENLRLVRLIITLFSNQIFKLFMLVIIVFLAASIATTKRANVSQVITTLTVSYLLPSYTFLIGIIFWFLPIGYAVFKVSEMFFLISVYEALSKGFGITRAKALAVVFVIVLFYSLLYIYLPSVFLTPFLI
ncbi:hypothetical protein Calkro_1839 [Caldicellulosiruptor kronotskyensis 2002]|uniref:Yip1 domain-containing protein n=1 Tax=Caldicellulosiruptor kronotskyensis (strain DSM 18902 / VKM B-2412 / 2002) TaxID=632348 RepID=E4SG10_CALK2|nr:hypothetical protein [Caldicellulosiruptor kronotskyensis]ADQ46685.1 hypothetical protein Calkro_1839 [Caldicellulosiruptor kronotskyensis 2002]